MAWPSFGRNAYPVRGYADTYVNPYVDQHGWMHLGPRRYEWEEERSDVGLNDAARTSFVPVGSLSPEVDGFCYLHLIPRSNWQVTGMRFGANPLLSDLMMLPPWELDFSSLDDIGYDWTTDGVIHLSFDRDCISFSEFLYSEKLLLKYCRSFMRVRLGEIAQLGWRVGGKTVVRKSVPVCNEQVDSVDDTSVLPKEDFTAADKEMDANLSQSGDCDEYGPGYCYLRLIREEDREQIRDTLGPDPKVSEFLFAAGTALDDVALSRLNIVKVQQGVYHVVHSAGGGAREVLVRTLANCEGYDRLRHVLGDKCGIGTSVPVLGIIMHVHDTIGGVASILMDTLAKSRCDRDKHGTTVSGVLSRLTVPGFEAGKVFSTYLSSVSSVNKSSETAVRERVSGLHCLDSDDWQLLIFPPEVIFQLNDDVVVSTLDREYWLYVKGKIKLRVAGAEYWCSVTGVGSELAVRCIWADMVKACCAVVGVARNMAVMSVFSWELMRVFPKCRVRKRLTEDRFVTVLDDGLCYTEVFDRELLTSNGVGLHVANTVIAWYA